MSYRTRCVLLLPLAAGSVLMACGGAPSAGDYASRGEDFITEGLDGQAERAGISFADPQCDDPPATSTGTIFSCTASGSDGSVYTFTVTIVGRNRMELVSEPPLPSATSATAPGSSPAAGATTVAPAAPPTTPPGT